MERIYLDYAATTPVDARVMRAMEPYFSEQYGNSGSLHSFGQEAIAAVDLARETIAKAIGANFREIIFTGSATEANNLALRGTVKTLCYSTVSKRPRIIIPAIEHESILETARNLGREGAEIVIIPVTKQGIVDLKKLEAALNERTVLVSVMYANNEIGTVQPISKIAKVINDFRNQGLDSGLRRNDNPSAHYSLQTTHYPLFHTDAVQAFQYLDCNVDALGVDPVRSRPRLGGATAALGRPASNGIDLMTLSAHKIYGPKGAGALYVRQHRAYGIEHIVNPKNHKPFAISPMLVGGGQEFGLRSGTENVPSIVGFAEAVKIAAAMREKERARINALAHYFWTGIKKIKHDARVNGVSSANQPSPRRLPNVMNVCLPGLLAQDALTYLDLRGIAVSSGSACSARSNAPSHVLTAIGCSEAQAKSSIRVSLGRMTTRTEIDRTLRVIRELILKLKV